MRSRPTAVGRRVGTALALLGVLVCVFAALSVLTAAPRPVRDGEAALTASPVATVARAVRPAAVAVVMVAATALALLATWTLGRRPALVPIPVPVRAPRGRGPPRSTSI